MLEAISTFRPLPKLTLEDVAYIRREFFLLEDLCFGRQGRPSDYRNKIRSRKLPLPAYVIDSVEFYPSDYFLFPDSIEPGSDIKKAFLARYRRIAAAYNESPSINIVNQEYEGYLSGEYGVCLKTVMPETIFLKGFVMARIDELFENPEPFDEIWRSKLRGLVNRLDGLERQLAPCDTSRFGSLPSRVRYIDRARKEYPHAFAFCYLPG